ncbi:hypothetical protein Tco_0705633 [Tanacetum coccineum]|uniref:Uncharacterized protein n=1 Tax=Tanacetum coccineum TaxID=301880 RepID=A0ABQ4Y785_9ASTR
MMFNGEVKKVMRKRREGVFLEEKGEEFGFDSKEDEVVPRVEDVSLVDGVLMVHLVVMEMMILLLDMVCECHHILVLNPQRVFLVE